MANFFVVPEDAQCSETDATQIFSCAIFFGDFVNGSVDLDCSA